VPDTGDRRRAALSLAALLTVSGCGHFVVPEAFARIIPAALGAPYPWVYGSGAAELLCAGGLAVPRTRRLAGYATGALFVAVFPANVQMALAAGDRSALYRAVVYARLPVQVPLVLWALAVARPGLARPGRASRRAPRPPRRA